MKKYKKFLVALTSLMLVTPLFTAPKLPSIPNITGIVTLPESAKETAKEAGAEAAKNTTVNVTLSEDVKEAAKKAGAEAAKNIKIDWSKFNFSFN